jgi:hypothetical protein
LPSAEVEDRLTMRPNFSSRHVRLARLGHEEGAAQVHAHDGVPVVHRHLEQHVVADDAGVVHQERRGAELGGDPLDGRGDLLLVRDVAPTAMACPPAAVISSTVPWQAASSRSTTATLWPSWAKRMATALPMPRAAPVTTAVRWVLMLSPAG